MVLFVVFSVVLLMIALLLFIMEPYPLGMMLIFSCVGLCYGLSYYVSSLLSFLVFMSYVGGVMVLFLYVVSIHPNQKFNVSFKWHFLWISLFLTSFWLFGWYLNMSLGQSSLKSFHFVNVGNFTELYLLMGVILLVNLCVVCNICMKKTLPLRSV
uniref:NADH dehydrogenase subunit 6 n=1 Tax=Brachidontes exustus TaxID=40254 RepID=A0A0U1XDE0_BRAEX|nr:NADH dehydrogenase subunit 6 [Brachidontes exustus]AIM58713.1 NADH dehydrogenase subunit 6 [Brachidontes exustus]